MRTLTFEIKEVGQEAYTKSNSIRTGQFNTPFSNTQGIAKFNT